MSEGEGDYMGWLADRPACVQALAKRHPIGGLYEVRGKDHWLIGYNEANLLVLTPVNPHEDLDGAYSADFIYVCADHYEDVE